VAAHAVALVAVGSLVLTSAFAAAPSQQQPAAAMLQVATVDDSEPSRLLPAQLPLDATVRTQGANQTAAAAFNPRLGLPRWLRTLRETPLWSRAEAGAEQVGTLPAGPAYLRPLGSIVDTRLDVYFAGDATHLPTLGWIDVSAVEPSGVPPWVATPAAQAPPPGQGLPTAPRKVGDVPPPKVSAWYVAVVDDASGQLLYGEQEHVSVPQASITKIATTIVALERSADLNRRVKVSVSASAMVARDGSSTMGIEPGRTVSLNTLLHGMMLPSGNDAAEQVALSVADSREQFVGWMNDEAAALGLEDTHFANPSGMDAAGHYSSAYDMAMLARYAMRNPTFQELAGSSHYAGDSYQMYNLNRFLDIYPGADGVKIGYTDLAQKTIVASAIHNGRRVYVSLLPSADLVGDSWNMFDWVWDNWDWSTPTPQSTPGQSAL
jgi:D-alanyl-D-alanine carboxypeptidase